MLVDGLSLKDFKCFEEVDIEFGKITLLTGANSSGKSSLIYALLGIMQSKHFPQFFALNGKLVNMGGFEDVIRKNSNAEHFEIVVTFKGEKLSSTWKQNTFNEQPLLVDFIYQDISFTKHISIEYEERLDVNLTIKRETYGKIIEMINDKNLRSAPSKWSLRGIGVLIENIELEKILNSDYEIVLEDDKIVQIRYSFPNLELLNETIFHNVPTYEDTDFSDFNYIGSFRLPPERTYYSKPNASLIGVNGEGYIDQIISWEEHDRELLDNLIYEIKELGLLSHIETNRMKGGRFEVNVKTNKNSSFASLTDVGFGISQFLPIIVADFQLKDDSCLAVSQPEIHLHPKIQATLGDYFARQIKKTEKQYIVETHSEYLINRLRLLIVKGELNPDDVKLYYMENDGDKTTTYKIELTTDGQIKNAPQGFFDTYEMDVMDIALFASAQ
ncbi:AAA family ATPase [Flectobacillus longus]|uniref:AAA family ATPase n=1 Tax=Flectobacillus longus TaxID=2984207 RepID=UPI0024B77D4C|nr:DUF3696 domain-containing protein [Flectobacillus longus]MDI9882280.1 DUF3696 domain-containing protein [Flectobacillus longus]